MWQAIVNPGAGRRSVVGEVDEILEARGIRHRMHVTESPSHLAEVVRTEVSAGRTDLLVVGGDGTVNLVVNALLEDGLRARLAVLPAGTGCDLVRTFGIPQDLAGAAEHLLTDDTYTIDIGWLDGPWGRRYFANVATIGLGAAVVRVAERFPARLGTMRYKLAVWPALIMFRKGKVSLTTPRRTTESEASLVVLANAQFFGGGMNVAPKASLVDGQLDVQLFTGPKRNAVVLQHRVTRGTHLTHKAVRRTSAPSVALELERPWEVEVDGEYLGTSASVSAGVIEGAIDLKI